MVPEAEPTLILSRNVPKQAPAKPLPSLKPETLSLLRTLTGHISGISSVAYSPDGQTLASGSADCTIKLWKLASGQEVGILTGHSRIVDSVDFSPDGQTFASGSRDGTIKIWGRTGGEDQPDRGGAGEAHPDGEFRHCRFAQHQRRGGDPFQASA